LLIGTGVLFAGLSLAQEPPVQPEDPPVRLKKKNKAPAEPPKDDEKKDLEKGKDEKAKQDEPKPEPGPGAKEDEKEVLERIARNMKSVEDRLANKELNEGTKQLQDDIIKDLDSLIHMAENPPPSSSQSGSGSPPPDGSDNKGSRQQQPNPMNGNKNQGDTNPGNMQPMNPGTSTNPDGSARTSGSDDPPKPPSDDDKSTGRIALRETKRTQAKTEGSNGESVPKYQELIQAYRKNLARPKDSR